ncbi:hypothetical protein Btru_073654 [Bulinus truncatus]|nr:hypothetical protein Btru_073654 [Bulinus truncatus]
MLLPIETQGITDTEHHSHRASQSQGITVTGYHRHRASQTQGITDTGHHRKSASQTQGITDTGHHRRRASQTQDITEKVHHRRRASQTHDITDTVHHRRRASQTQGITDAGHHRHRASQTQGITDTGHHRRRASQTQGITDTGHHRRRASQTQGITDTVLKNSSLLPVINDKPTETVRSISVSAAKRTTDLSRVCEISAYGGCHCPGACDRHYGKCDVTNCSTKTFQVVCVHNCQGLYVKDTCDVKGQCEFGCQPEATGEFSEITSLENSGGPWAPRCEEGDAHDGVCQEDKCTKGWFAYGCQYLSSMNVTRMELNTYLGKNRSRQMVTFNFPRGFATLCYKQFTLD